MRSIYDINLDDYMTDIKGWESNEIKQVKKFKFKERSWKIFNTEVFDEAIMIVTKLKRWFQVYTYPTCFGFSSVNGIIENHPDRFWEGRKLSQYYDTIIKPNKYDYVKIGEHEL